MNGALRRGLISQVWGFHAHKPAHARAAHGPCAAGLEQPASEPANQPYLPPRLAAVSLSQDLRLVTAAIFAATQTLWLSLSASPQARDRVVLQRPMYH